MHGEKKIAYAMITTMSVQNQLCSQQRVNMFYTVSK